jgi:hypothetical protein
MDYDFAIIYFGLTRSVRKTHETHKKHVFDILAKENLTYKTFMHTWKTTNDVQNVWDKVIPQKIDYSEYKLLSPDFYMLDDENKFLESLNMDDYYYKHEEDKEWIPKMVSNHLCMLESQKRGFGMVKESILKGDKFKFIMFIRPDITIHNDLNISKILANHNKILVPDHDHHEGINDQFAIMNYEYAQLYGNRIDEIADFRKANGRIVGEKYCKFIIIKYRMELSELNFNYSITRP